MGSTNRTTLGYVAEVTKGTTPANPPFVAFRHTSDGLALTPSRQASNEIRSDRQVADQILLDLAAAGSIGIELSFAAHDTMIEAAFQGTWSSNPVITVVTIDTEISDVSTTTLTVAAGGAAYKAGMLTYNSGFTTSANNGLFRVASSSGTTIVYPAASFTAEGAQIPVGASVRVVGFQGAAGDLITATASGIADTTVDFTTLGVSDGEWLKIGGDGAGNQFATAANNSWARVAKGGVTAHAITFDVLPVGWGVDAGTGKTVQIFMADFLTNGTTQRAFSFERQQQDIAVPSYETFNGHEVDTFSLDFKSASVITGSFGYTGRGAPAALTTRAAGASDVAAAAYPVLNAAANVGRLMEAGVVTTTLIEELGFDLKNNLARDTAVGTVGAANVRDGEIGLSGTLSAYFGDITLINKVLSDTVTSLMVRAGRSDGNRESILLDIPEVKLSGTAPVSGKNASRMFNGTYDAFRHPTLGYTMSCSRFWYLPVAV